MGLRDRLATNSAKHQEGMPAASKIGYVTSVVGFLFFTVLGILIISNGGLGAGLLMLGLALLSAANIWLVRLGRSRRLP